MFGDEDLPTFFGDMGVPVMFKGVSTYPNGKPILGNFDRPLATKLADMGFGGITSEAPCVRLPYNAFRPMPRSKDVLFVDGCKYEVSEPSAESDGGVIVYDLKAVSK